MRARFRYALSMVIGMQGWGIAAAQGGADLAAVRRAIDAQNDAWETATKAGDAAAIARVFADSGVELSLRQGKTWKGRAAIQQLFTEIYQNPHATDARVETDQVILDGTTAVEYGHYTHRWTTRSGAMVHTTHHHEQKMTATAVYFADGRTCIMNGRFSMRFPRGTHIRISRNLAGSHSIEQL